MSNISIIGSGRVGYTSGIGFEGLGHMVFFYDVDEGVITRLKESGHKASTDLKHVVELSSASFICVPTFPSEHAGSSKLVSAVKDLANVLKGKQGYHLIVIRSTVVPTTTERILIPLLIDSGKKLGKELGICVNPDFSTEIASTWTHDPQYYRYFFSQDRIVIGEYDKRSGDVLEAFYKPLQKPIFRTNLRTAEIIKCVANCMLATKISFWNEMFLICQKLDINSQQVAEIVALDPRIGKYGTAHGKAFGGKCLPKDLEAFISFAWEHYPPMLLTVVKQINDYMKENYGVRGKVPNLHSEQVESREGEKNGREK